MSDSGTSSGTGGTHDPFHPTDALGTPSEEWQFLLGELMSVSNSLEKLLAEIGARFPSRLPGALGLISRLLCGQLQVQAVSLSMGISLLRDLLLDADVAQSRRS